MSSIKEFGNGGEMGDHHSSEELAAYLSNGLNEEARNAFEAHISECRQCRDETMSARHLVETGRVKKSQWIVPSAIAAVLAIAFLSTTISQRGPEEPVRAESEPSSSGSAIGFSIVGPSDGSVVSGNPSFTWRVNSPNALYKLAVTEAAGTVVWSAETSDTTLALPAHVSLAAEREYLWSVNAIDPDGTSVTTGTHRFRITR